MTFVEPANIPAKKLFLDTALKSIDCFDSGELEKQIRIMATDGWRCAGIANRPVQGWVVVFQREN